MKPHTIRALSAPAAAFALALAAVTLCPRPARGEEPAPGPNWIEQLDSGDLAARRKAVYEIWKRLPGLKGAGPALARAVGSEDEYLRGTAVKAIWKLQALPDEARTVIPGLVEALKSARAPVRVDAAALLARMPRFAADSAEKLAGSLEDADPSVRANIAVVLGVAGYRAKKTVVPALVKCLTDPAADVRKWSAQALGTLDPGSIPDALVDRLDDKDPKVRADAAMLLGYSFGYGREVLPRLVKAAADPDETVRVNALSSIAAIGPEDAIPALLTALKDASATVRLRALAALGGCDSLGDAARTALGKAVADPDPTVGGTALALYGNLPDADLSVVRPLLESSERNRKWQAINLLVGRKDPAVVAPLTAMLKNGDPASRSFALGSLSRLGAGAKEDLDEVLRLAGSEDSSVAGSALSAAVAIAPASEKVRKLLREQLSGGDPNGAIWAVSGLGEDGAPYVSTLVELLPKSEGYTRQILVSALGRLGPAAKPAIPALLALMQKDEKLRMQIAGVLLGFEGKPGEVAMDVMIGALKDPATQASAIGQLTYRGPAAAKALPALVSLLESASAHPAPPAGGATITPSGGGSSFTVGAPAAATPNMLAAAIAKIGGPEAGKKGYDYLLTALASEDPYDPAAEDAGIRIGGLGPDAAGTVPALIRALHSVNPMLRGAAAEALGRIGPAAKAALPRLLELEPLASPNVRRTIRASLARIRGEK